MQVPWQALTEDALNGLIQEFVSREGTEYGAHEVPLQQKVQQVKDQLRSGAAVIVYDEETDSTSILASDALGPSDS